MSRYEWIPDWVQLPPAPAGWMHSGVAVIDEGVVVAHPGEPTLLVFGFDGTSIREIPLPGLLEPHGFRVAAEGLWIGDVGFKRRVRGPQFETERGSGRVVLVDNRGRVMHEIADPGSGWSPTAIAVDEASGDVTSATGRTLASRSTTGRAVSTALSAPESSSRPRI